MDRLFPVRLQSDGAKATSLVICIPHCSIHSSRKPRSVVKTLGFRRFYINRNPKFTSKGFLICRENSPKPVNGCLHRKKKSMRGKADRFVGLHRKKDA